MISVSSLKYTQQGRIRVTVIVFPSRMNPLKGHEGSVTSQAFVLIYLRMLLQMYIRLFQFRIFMI